MNQRIKKLAAYLKKNPDDSFSKFGLALEFLKADEAGKACVLFESIRENDPDYVGVYYHLGKLYERIGTIDQSKAIYREGISVAERQNDQHAKSELQTALMNLEINEYE